MLMIACKPKSGEAAASATKDRAAARQLRAEGRELRTKALEAFRIKDLEVAARFCDEALGLNPEDMEANNLRGALYMEARDFEAARDMFQKAAGLGATPDPDVLFNLAEVDFVEKKWRESASKFNELLKQAGEKLDFEGIVHFKLAVIALKLGDSALFKEQQLVFQEKEMKLELAYTGALVRMHEEEPGKEVIESRVRALLVEHPDSAPLADTLLEAYAR